VIFEVTRIALRNSDIYGVLQSYLSVILAYTQVITFTIYTYLFSNLFGHQYLEPRGSNVDKSMFPELGIGFSLNGPLASHTPVVYIPIYTIIEFIAYLGWIKVAETLLNPWGDDDEDFQVNYLIDRNFQVC
jgi:bestrophin-2